MLLYPQERLNTDIAFLPLLCAATEIFIVQEPGYLTDMDDQELEPVLVTIAAGSQWHQKPDIGQCCYAEGNQKLI